MRLNFLNFFIFLAMIFGIWHVVRAAEITAFSFDDSAKIMRAEGECLGHSVAICVFAASSTEPFYTAGGGCADGKFNFQDDLSYWKISPGDYRAVAYDANSPLSNPSEEKNFTVAASPPEQYLPPEPPNNSTSSMRDAASGGTSTEEPATAAQEDFFAKILDALVRWFADAVLKIKELVVQKISVSNLCVGETCINEGDLKVFLKNKRNSGPDINEMSKEKEDGEQKEQTEPMPIPPAELPESATSSIMEPMEAVTSTL